MKKIKIFYMEKCPYCEEMMDGLDKLGYEYEKIDVNSDEGEKEFMKLYEFTKNDNIPVVIVGNQILVPEIAFYTIENGLKIIESLYSEST
jgi:glutaredoxin